MTTAITRASREIELLNEYRTKLTAAGGRGARRQCFAGAISRKAELCD